MTDSTGFFTCQRICWIIGALVGFAFFLMIPGFFVSLIIGIIVFIGAALGLQKLLCADAPTALLGEKGASASTDSADTTRSDEVAANAANIPAAAMDGAPVPVEAATAPVDPAPKSTADAPVDDTKIDDQPKPAKAPAKASGQKVQSGVSTKPRTMKAPRKAGADDLKQLKGVGPKLETQLNALGFWHFDQIAKWTADEIAWVDDNLSFKGRIERDGWVEQAKTLAEGGETAFSKKVKKGDVYKG
ncbi:NADH:ubiquinone oxidoreductase [Aliiroseovarius sediminis]|uniref:NADH:ubiquinone oxidoreductase n=1 Tax=Aliiroseovarius sediminis TaxID=2925839 RepID=UPI001F570F26|nr:NADH:ubiquinone oxidoreductase [Aliiroseovarius sediminis]MCI2393025.1 NADH:ubiquinone oxidoreductase [Aliiroseovarius sediminis]